MSNSSLNQAEFKVNRVKENGLVVDFYQSFFVKKRKAIIFCYGLPSHHFDRFPFGLNTFLREGYLLCYPHYFGTFGSDGLCNLENAVDSILEAVKIVSRGESEDALSQENIDLAAEEIILAGGSFGGSIALVAGAKSPLIRRIISCGAPTDYRVHGRTPELVEYDLEGLMNSLKRGYPNEWRIDFSIWERFTKGLLDINPVDYVNILKDKDTLLIHGLEDQAVSFVRSAELNCQLSTGMGNHRLSSVIGKGHLGIYYIQSPEIIDEVRSFMK